MQSLEGKSIQTFANELHTTQVNAIYRYTEYVFKSCYFEPVYRFAGRLRVYHCSL